MKVRGSRRFREQKWLLDSVISTIGLDWDLLRMSTVTAPIGFEGMGDWAVVAGKAKRFDDISPSFEEVAAGREARAREAERERQRSHSARVLFGGFDLLWRGAMADRRDQRTKSRPECEEARLLRAIRVARASQDRAGRDPDGQARRARLAAFSCRRKAAIPDRDHAARHGYLQREARLGLWRQDARTRLRGTGDRRSRAVRSLDARAEGYRRQFRRCRPRLSGVDRYPQRSRPGPHWRVWTELRLLCRNGAAPTRSPTGFAAWWSGFRASSRVSTGFSKRRRRPTRIGSCSWPDTRTKPSSTSSSKDSICGPGCRTCAARLMVLGGELDELAPIKHVFEVARRSQAR